MSADTDGNRDELDVPATERDHGLGPIDAPVTLIEYGDYECPDCFNAEPVVSALRARFGERLRVVFRHFPRNSIHPRSGAAAAAAEAAAGQGRFWDMHSALFRHQKELADLDLTHLALRIGLEPYRFQAATESTAVQRHVQTDYDGAVRNGVKGTPTFFINNRRYRGPAEVEAMAKAIEGAMNQA
jgi:protein-disulfide isomerase